jgi:hypothetical protein
MFKSENGGDLNVMSMALVWNGDDVVLSLLWPSSKG